MMSTDMCSCPDHSCKHNVTSSVMEQIHPLKQSIHPSVHIQEGWWVTDVTDASDR